MMNTDYTSTLLTVVDTIEKICRAHVAVAGFDYGDLQDFNDRGYHYPLCYLETIQDMQENENGSTHTYSVALNILDLIGEGLDSRGYLSAQDKLQQMFFEIKDVMQLDYFFEKERVGSADVLIFSDFADAKTIRLRAEFTVELECPDNETPDLEQIFPGLF